MAIELCHMTNHWLSVSVEVKEVWLAYVDRLEGESEWM